MSNLIKITVERGGEESNIQVPSGTRISDLVGNGTLQDLTRVTTLVDGSPCSTSTQLYDGVTITQLPKQGKQG